MNERDRAKEFARELNRAARRRRKVLGIRMADLATANSLQPANSTNGMTFHQLVQQLKGASA